MSSFVHKTLYVSHAYLIVHLVFPCLYNEIIMGFFCFHYRPLQPSMCHTLPQSPMCGNLPGISTTLANVDRLFPIQLLLLTF